MVTKVVWMYYDFLAFNFLFSKLKMYQIDVLLIVKK